MNSIFENLKNLDEKGIVFVKSEKDVNKSYASLYKKSLKYLAFLQDKGIMPGMEAIFQVNNEEDFIVMCWACLQGGIIPVPLNVATNYEQFMNIRRIWNILDKPFIISEKEIIDKFYNFLVDNKENELFDTIKSKTILIEPDTNMSMNLPILYESKPDDTALLQFSSGSTGDPKAIIITYKNLLINITSVKDGWNINENTDCSLSWMPLTHAMGLILVHFTSVLSRINQVIMPPALFVENPILWLKKADEYNATLLSSPNFGMKHVIETITDNMEDNINLSKVRMICNAAEPISYKICNRFLDILEKFNLHRNTIVPLLGMTEVTAGVTTCEIGESLKVYNIDRRFTKVGDKIQKIVDTDYNAVTLVDLGRPFSCCSIRICDDANNNLGEETIGYIQVSGETVTNGYYKNKEATNATFSDDGWLITGDLGFISDGGLVITGRAKDIIFINGQNYYPVDIERIAETAEGLNGRKVISYAVNDLENQKDGVGIFVEYGEDIHDFIEISMNIKKIVNEKMGLDVYDVVPVEKIPKTSSGKVLRYQLGKSYNDGKFTATLHKISKILMQELMIQEKNEVNVENKLELELLEIWKRVLDNNSINVDTNYFNYGINSIVLLKIAGILREEYSVNVSISTFHQCKTIKNLAKIIDENSK